MKRLYVFGDSFSDENIISNNKSYINWKGYTPKTFHQLLSEELNIPSFVNADGGIDNYTIFSNVCKNINQMDNSIIIIGWTDIHRFRLYDSTFQSFKSVSPTFGARRMRGFPYINGVSDSTIEEIFINRDGSIWKDEISDFVKIINKALSNSIVIHWSWATTNRQTITEETDGNIVDFHYSENGHYYLNKFILTQLKNGSNGNPFVNTSII